MMEVDLVAKALRLMLCVLNLFLLDIVYTITLQASIYVFNL
ncbi:unnamed protein product, partial [Musa banksii]